MPDFQHLTYVENVRSIDEIMSELAKHELAMAGTAIQRLVFFSRTYAVVNRNIDRALADGVFLSSGPIRKLQLNFAKLYFDMLNQYARTKTMPREWKLACNGSINRFIPASFSLLLAIRAHIQCDATAAIRIASSGDELCFDDYRRIESIIVESSNEVISSYDPSSPLKPLHAMIDSRALKPLCWIIFRWRMTAWKQSMTLERPLDVKHRRDQLVTETEI